MNPIGDGWIKIDGKLKQISSGEYGVWGVNANDEIFYRKGVNNYNLKGDIWEKVSGGLKYIENGIYGIWGVNCNDEIWIRI